MNEKESLERKNKIYNQCHLNTLVGWKCIDLRLYFKSGNWLLNLLLILKYHLYYLPTNILLVHPAKKDAKEHIWISVCPSVHVYMLQYFMVLCPDIILCIYPVHVNNFHYICVFIWVCVWVYKRSCMRVYLNFCLYVYLLQVLLVTNRLLVNE